MVKWRRGLVLSVVSGMLLLAGCGGQSSGGEKKYTVGISMFADHPSLNAATEGFKKALEDAEIDVEYVEQNALGETNNTVPAAQNLVDNDVDLIFANATPSAQAALGVTEDHPIPVVFTSVTDPIGAELVDSMEKPGKNATGTADMHPDAIPSTIEFIDKYMEGTKIGTIYNAAEQNSVKQIEVMKEAMEGTDLTLVDRTIANTSELTQAANSLVGEVDVIFIITDNTVVNGLEAVISVSQDNDIPLFVGELDSVEKGGFAAYGFDYFDIGYEAGELALQILLEDKDPSELPAQYPQNLKLLINKKAAEAMGIELQDEWNDIAEYLE